MTVFGAFRRATLIAVAIASTTAASSGADDRELARLLNDGLAGRPFDANAFAAAVEASRAEHGHASLGIYEGEFVPLRGSVDFAVPNDLSYHCATGGDVIAGPGGSPPDFIPASEDRYVVRANDDGTKSILFETRDTEGVITFEFRTNGVDADVERVVAEFGPDQVVLLRAADGYTETVTGAHYGKDSAEVQMFESLAEAVVAGQAFWFETSGTLSVGSPFLEDAIRRSVEPIAAAVAALGEVEGNAVTMNVTFLSFLLTGETLIGDAPHLVFEGGLRGSLAAPQGEFPFTVVTYQTYDETTFVPTVTMYSFGFGADGSGYTIELKSTCEPG